PRRSWQPPRNSLYRRPARDVHFAQLPRTTRPLRTALLKRVVYRQFAVAQASLLATRQRHSTLNIIARTTRTTRLAFTWRKEPVRTTPPIRVGCCALKMFHRVRPRRT